MTVYASLMFLVVLLLLSMCLEGAYLYLGKGKAQGAYMAALAGARGNYQKELEQQYHLFGLDVRYGKQLDEKLAEALKYNLTESRDPFSFYPGSVRTSHKVSLADRRGEILREQIAEFMKYDLGKDGIRLLTDNVFKMPKEDDASRAREVINEADREAKEEEEAEETGKNAGEIKRSEERAGQDFAGGHGDCCTGKRGGSIRTKCTDRLRTQGHEEGKES